MLFITWMKILSLWWHAIFNTHFPVSVNFVLFVYFDVFFLTQFYFDEYLSFLLIIAMCHIIAMVLWHMLKTISKSRHFSMIFFIHLAKILSKAYLVCLGDRYTSLDAETLACQKTVFEISFFSFISTRNYWFSNQWFYNASTHLKMA